MCSVPPAPARPGVAIGVHLASPRSFVDICPPHKALAVGSVCVIGSASPARVQSWNGGGLQVHWLTEPGRVHGARLPSAWRRAAAPGPALKSLGPLGLSLQLKLKHESGPGCCSLCAGFAGGPCQSLSGKLSGAALQDLRPRGGLRARVHLRVASLFANTKVTFGMPGDSHHPRAQMRRVPRPPAPASPRSGSLNSLAG